VFECPINLGKIRKISELIRIFNKRYLLWESRTDKIFC